MRVGNFYLQKKNKQKQIISVWYVCRIEWEIDDLSND